MSPEPGHDAREGDVAQRLVHQLTSLQLTSTWDDERDERRNGLAVAFTRRRKRVIGENPKLRCHYGPSPNEAQKLPSRAESSLTLDGR